MRGDRKTCFAKLMMGTLKRTITQISLSLLSIFQQIAHWQVDCLRFDTELTCFERMAILKHKRRAEGRPTDNFLSIQ